MTRATITDAAGATRELNVYDVRYSIGIRPSYSVVTEVEIDADGAARIVDRWTERLPMRPKPLGRHGRRPTARERKRERVRAMQRERRGISYPWNTYAAVRNDGASYSRVTIPNYELR